MKKYFALFIASITLILSVVACKKNAQVVNLNSYNTSSTALLPLKVGDIWIYQDSTYDTTNTLKSVIIDTAQVQNQSIVYSDGVPFWQITETDTSGYGFFGNIFYTNHPNSYNSPTIYATDTSYKVYFIWGTPTADGAQLTQTSTDFSNLSCGITGNNYGFTTSYTINGYTNCYKNLYQEQSCKGITSEVSYFSAGTGLVRYEIWVEYAGSSTPHMIYSQTLTKFIVK